MKIDNRTFLFAGSSADANGVYKARFANKLDTRPKVMAKLFGYTDVKFVELPKAMTKLEAIAWLLETKPEGVNLDSLTAKDTYIKTQIAKINGTLPAKKRGRPRKNPVVATSTVASEVPVTENIVKTIVKTARGNSLRAKATNVATKVAAARK